MEPLHFPAQNQLLGALPAAAFMAFAEDLQLVPLRLGDVLYEPGSQLAYVYFPTTAIVSLHYVTETGDSTETAGVGHEGLVGISLFLGGDTTPSAATVQTGGHAYRLERRLMMLQFDRAGALRELFLRYTAALIAQTAQTAACNRHHSVHQQLCRWLLLTLDRIPSGQLVMTQELIASMLGVRREGVTEAAGRLQKSGYIRYRRGHIAVLSRSGLETESCECYDVVKREVNGLLSNRTAVATSSA